jgi:NAD(P)-dependent dehydrogenase (short-subunit alcohol dehydrogenase family)
VPIDEEGENMTPTTTAVGADALGMLADKVAIITGASRGIGAAAARLFAEAGASVALGARNAAALESLVREIEGRGGRAIAVPTDVTDEAAVAGLVQKTVDAFGRLDVALNNAGGGPSGMTGVAETSPAELDSALKLNLYGAFLAMKREIVAMLRSGGGAIVNTSSGAGLGAPAPGTSPYVTAKHALQGLTKVAALDYATQGVRVNAIAPGPIDTDLLAGGGEEGRRWAARGVPMQRLGRPEEVAAAALWLCSDHASFVTGATLEVDGGQAAT